MNSFPILRTKTKNKYYVYRTDEVPFGYNRNSWQGERLTSDQAYRRDRFIVDQVDKLIEIVI